jgi:hypothetical protein
MADEQDKAETSVPDTSHMGPVHKEEQPQDQAKTQEAPPPKPKMRIDPNAAASVKIFRPAVAPATEPVVETFDVARNTLMLTGALKEKLNGVTEAELLTIKVEISTKAVEVLEQPPTTLLDAPVAPVEPKTIDVMMFEGNSQDVMTRLISMCVPPEYASMALQGFIMDPLVGLTECTSLQIAMVTLCFEDKGIGGFTIVNNKIPFEPGAALMMVEAASGQIDAFKVEMIRKHNVQFPGDSKIITPGQSRFSLPGGGKKRR